MSFKSTYHHNCTNCKQSFSFEITHDDNSIKEKKPTTLRCINCEVDYFLCPQCQTDHCLICNLTLIEKTKTFPNTLFQSIRDQHTSRIIDICEENWAKLHITLEKTTGHTPLAVAALTGNEEIIKILINRFNLNDCIDANGRTPLMILAMYRSPQWTKRVAALLADTINAQDSFGKTALMYAAKGTFGSYRGSITVLSNLLDLGADPTITDHRGRNAIGIAMHSNSFSKKSSNDRVIEFLKKATIKYTAISMFYENYRYNFDERGNLETTPLFHNKF